MLTLPPLFDYLSDYSRTHCVAICAVLVPANILATAQTTLLLSLGYPSSTVQLSAGFASFAAGTMILHVLSWFAIGVVMAPTYILLVLAAVCLSVNSWAVGYPANMLQGLNWLRSRSSFLKQRIYPN